MTDAQRIQAALPLLVMALADSIPGAWVGLVRDAIEVLNADPLL